MLQRIGSDFTYVGSELDVFSHATNWKSYWSGKLSRYIGADVLDVGAGKGATARLLCGAQVRQWIALEPDPRMAADMAEEVRSGTLSAKCIPTVGGLDAIRPEQQFDSILYIDVLEHIEHDRDELANAARHLKPNGRIVVLSPAHQWLFTPFDKAIGHFRRYDAATLTAATPSTLRIDKVFYLDSIGVAASLANRLLLQSSMPTVSQIKFWDGWMIPVSRVVDPVIGNRLGKTVIGVFSAAP